MNKISKYFHAVVPAVAIWKRNILKGVNPKDVELLLRSCDRRTHKGRRSYAMILLMAHLGLRRGEVSRLTLDCINWSSGEIKIQNSKGSSAILPLSDEIGRALSSYLQKSRPEAKRRNIFLRLRAPHNPVSGRGVTHALRSVCVQASIQSVSTHQLRHTAASRMLQKGSSLQEISQVLRHSSVDTTSIYAKIDDLSLENVVQEWAGGVL